jgi:hypothetical protein
VRYSNARLRACLARLKRRSHCLSRPLSSLRLLLASPFYRDALPLLYVATPCENCLLTMNAFSGIISISIEPPFLETQELANVPRCRVLAYSAYRWRPFGVQPFSAALPLFASQPPGASLVRACSRNVRHQFGPFSALHPSLISVDRFQIHDTHNRDVNKCKYLYRQPPSPDLLARQNASNVGKCGGAYQPSPVHRPPSFVLRPSSSVLRPNCSKAQTVLPFYSQLLARLLISGTYPHGSE